MSNLFHILDQIVLMVPAKGQKSLIYFLWQKFYIFILEILQTLDLMTVKHEAQMSRLSWIRGVLGRVEENQQKSLILLMLEGFQFGQPKS